MARSGTEDDYKEGCFLLPVFESRNIQPAGTFIGVTVRSRTPGMQLGSLRNECPRTACGVSSIATHAFDDQKHVLQYV